MRPTFLSLFLVSFVALGHSQWLDYQTLNSTVLVEKWQDTAYVPFGTGFVLWNYGDKRYPIVMTAGHLLNRAEIFISANADSVFVNRMRHQNRDTIQFDSQKWVLVGNRLRTKIRLVSSSRKTFLLDQANDIGCFLIDLPTWSIDDRDTVRVAKFLTIGMSTIRKRDYLSHGDECYFIGFPFGLGADVSLDPIVRSGSVAWLSRDSKRFFLDAFSFGGNSGSPVFTKILLGRQPGILTWDRSFLVGMITGHLGEESQNWGLAIGTWSDAILELAKKASEITISD